jgi:FtsH-binding integral membrane protein
MSSSLIIGTQAEVRWRSVSNLINLWMAAGLAASGACALCVAYAPLMRGLASSHGFIFLLMLLAQIALAVVVNIKIGGFSTWQAIALFLAYSALTGMSLAGFTLIVARVSLAAMFATVALMFGLVSVYGTFTRHDLTQIDSRAVMMAAGIILASLVNAIVRSPVPCWIATYLAVAVFLALVAIDAEQMKHMDVRADETHVRRLAILGALVLYLDLVLSCGRLVVAVLRVYGSSESLWYPMGYRVPGY